MNFSKSDIPFPVIQLIDTLHEKGFEGWLVGGAIRTLMLGQKPKDWDVTTNATPNQVMDIFPRTIETGIAYGTVTVVMQNFHIQVTTFRKESQYENHRKPKEVFYCKNLEEDLSRRDFTINAMAFNPHTDEFRDPFDGQRDLEQQWIKAVGDATLRFKEDALRILRAVRFQSQLGFSIEETTLQAMQQDSKHLSSLSKERIQDEFGKWLLGDHWSMTQPTAQRINLPQIFDIPPANGFYKNWDQISTSNPTLLFRLSAFVMVYLDPKPISGEMDNCLKLLKSLKYGQNVISKVIQFIEFLSHPWNVDSKDERLPFLRKALEIGFCDARLLLEWKLEQSPHKQLLLKANQLLVQLQNTGFERKVHPLALDGNQVMDLLHLEPGPKVKTVLTDLQNAVLENPDLNNPESLEAYLQKK